MFSTELDIVLAIIFGSLMVVFFLGKGHAILELFSSSRVQQKKRTPEQEIAYQRAIAWFLLPRTIMEVLSIFITHSVFGIIMIIIVIIDLVVFVKLTRGM